VKPARSPTVATPSDMPETIPELLTTLDSVGKSSRIVRFILALALAIVGALGALYVLFFAAGGYFMTAMASAIFLGIGLIWLSDLVDAPSP
jgi:hypothetical protein